MDGTPVSVELELRAYKDSTSKIEELLPESGSMDTMDVIILSWFQMGMASSYYRAKPRFGLSSYPIRSCYADPIR